MISLTEALGLETGGIVSLVGAGGKTTLMYRLARELSAAGDTVLSTTTTKIMWPEPAESPHVIVSDSAPEILARAKELLDRTRHMTVVAGTHQPPPCKCAGLLPATVKAVWESGLFQWIVVEADGALRLPLKAPADYEPVIPAGSVAVVGVMGLNGVGRTLDEKTVFRPELFAAISGLKPGDTIKAEALAKVAVAPKGLFKDAPPAARKILFLNKADLPGALDAARQIVKILKRGSSGWLARIVIGQAAQKNGVIEYWDVQTQGGEYAGSVAVD